jgi:hypothetical protein
MQILLYALVAVLLTVGSRFAATRGWQVQTLALVQDQAALSEMVR